MRLSRSRETSEQSIWTYAEDEESEVEQVWGKAAAPDQELGDDIVCHNTI